MLALKYNGTVGFSTGSTQTGLICWFGLVIMLQLQS